MSNPEEAAPKGQTLFSAICFAGFVAGALDGLAAVALYLARGGKNPVRIFNFIASGVFGEAGLKGGLGMAFLGLLLHFVIAAIWSMIYMLVCSRYPEVMRRWIPMGLVYGIVVWLGMNLVVVPLSLTPPMAMSVSGVLTGIVVLMLCVGLPVAFLTKRHFHV